MDGVSLQDPWVQVAEVVRLIRTGAAQTRPELADATRLGRNVVTLRVQAAVDLGLIERSGALRSRGGRAAEVYQIAAGTGHLLVALHGPRSIRVVLADLRLEVVEQRRVDSPLGTDAALTCERIAREMESLLAAHPDATPWGVGIGLLAPVDFATGRSADPVSTSVSGPRWPRDFDVRAWFQERMALPCWVESVSNLMALGAAAQAGAPEDLVAVRMELGVGSGIVSHGHLHRGADWLAGETAHIMVRPDPQRVCLCGRAGCLDAYAGAWAVQEAARRVRRDGTSAYLAGLPGPDVDVDDVVAGAAAGDLACTEIVHTAADALGRVLAAIVTWFNPRRVVIGGNSLAASPLFSAALIRTVQSQALAASLEGLEIRQGDPDRFEEIRGALALVRDQLLAPAFLATWGPHGSPAHLAAL